MWPRPLGNASLQPRAGLWQVAQEMAPDPDNRGSKNNIWPRATFSGVIGLLLLTGMAAGRRNSASRVCGSVLVALELLPSEPARVYGTKATPQRSKAREIQLRLQPGISNPTG